MLRQRFYRRAGLALTVLALLACRKAEPGTTHLTLRPGLSLAGRIEPGSTRRFAFELRRDQYLALRVTQEAIDVTLTLHPPEGERWAPLDTQSVVPTPEILRVVAPREGRYLLDIEAAGKRGEGTVQPFRLEVAELRPATARDRRVVEAQGELARAEELRRRKEPASDLRSLPLYQEAIRLYKQAGEAAGEGYARVQWARVLERQNRKEEEGAECIHFNAEGPVRGVPRKAQGLRRSSP